MGDGEMVVAETSTVAEYALAGNNSTGNGGTNLNNVPDSSVYTTGSTGVFAESADAVYTVLAASNFADRDIYGTDYNSVIQGSHFNATYETKPDVGMGDTSENVADMENASVAPSQAAGYGSSINGIIGGEAGTTASAENGATADIAEEVDAPVLPMSSEDERFWNIVRVDDSDFDAWIALFYGIEKIKGDNILKIRKLYDVFLAEFPLCYGYWKKYADHELRMVLWIKLLRYMNEQFCG